MHAMLLKIIHTVISRSPPEALNATAGCGTRQMDRPMTVNMSGAISTASSAMPRHSFVLVVESSKRGF